MSVYNDRSVSQALLVALLIRMYYNLLSNLCVIAPLGKFWIFTGMHDVAIKNTFPACSHRYVGIFLGSTSARWKGISYVKFLTCVHFFTTK